MLKQPKEITVLVVRAFSIGGEPVPVDTVITLETPLARELIAAGKATETNEAPRAPRPPAAPAASKRAGGKKDDEKEDKQ